MRMTTSRHNPLQRLPRRDFLTGLGGGLGLAALNSLFAAETGSVASHFNARAKRVIYLFQSGAPRKLNCSITSRSCSSTGEWTYRSRFDGGRD